MNNSSRSGFFNAIINPQSYRNILYLLLALPLGTVYFVFAVTGLSVGAGLMVTLAGLPLTALVLEGSSIMCRLERALARILLRIDINAPAGKELSGGVWSRTKSLLSDRSRWSGIFYLIFRFPVGTAAFTAAVVGVAVSLAFLFAPAYMWASDPLVWGDHILNPYPAAWVLSVIGIPLTFISLNLLNGTARGLGEMTRAMLGSTH